MQRLMLAVLLFSVVCASASPLPAARIPPNYATNLTVYHLNPKAAGQLPVNMDTGDAFGDLYFYLGQFLLPLECQNVTKQSRAHFDCDNPERTSTDLVVTQVDLTIDSRTTTYSACNLCNGTDPFSGAACTKGTYICDCESHHKGDPKCDATKVGTENVTEHFAPAIPTAQCNASFHEVCPAWIARSEHLCYACLEHNYKKLEAEGCAGNAFDQLCPNPWQGCKPGGPDWACWAENIPRKTGGMWYSTLDKGQCGGSNGAMAGSQCGWEVSSLKTIKESCLKKHLVATVESHDTANCFSGCAKPGNYSDPCWIGCFFDTLLGPAARSSMSAPLAGMTLEEVEKSWTGAFKPVQEGGCEEISL